MRILIINNLYRPRLRGGAETIVEVTAQELQARGHEVSIITTGEFRSFRSRTPYVEDVNGIRVYRFYPMNLYDYYIGHRMPILVRVLWHVIDLFNVYAAVQVIRIARKEAADVLIGHNLMGLGFLIPRLVQRSGFRYVQVVHDVQLYAPSGLIRVGHEQALQYRFLRMIGYHALIRWLFGTVRLAIAPARSLLDFYGRHGFFNHARREVLQNPVALPADAYPHQPAAQFRILYVGQVSEEKGALGLALAVRELSDRNIDATFIGDGSAFDAVKSIAELSAGKIAVIGRVSQQELPRHFAIADVLIVPSLCYDTFPTVILEALRCGVPVIASDSGGAPEIVRHGINGWIVPTGDWQALIQLLRRLEQDRSLAIAAASQAQPSVAGLTPEHYIDQLLSVLADGRHPHVLHQ